MRTSLIIIMFLSVSVAANAQQGLLPPVVWADSSKIFDSKVPSLFFEPAKFQPKLVKEIPKDIYTRNFGFFCKQELKLHQAHVPLTFRLGSMDYCNYLEQKTGAGK